MFDSLKERFENIFSSLRGKGKLSEEDINLALREVRRALLEADVNYKVVKDVVEAIRVRATGREVLDSITPSQLIFTIVYEELIKIMGDAPAPLVISPKPPTVYMMVGLQGSGKTTTTVKIARRMSKGHKPLVVACDLRRPAAVDQLRVLAEKANIAFFGPEPGETDPVAVARKSRDYAESHLCDMILLDTAGRLQMDDELMRMVDVLVVNRTEAATLSGTDHVEEAASRLHARGAKNVIVTLGAEGAYAFNGHAGISLPAFRVQAVDAVGAGDTFCGALAVAFARRGQVNRDGLEFAMAAAALAVTKAGAQPSIPTEEETNRFLEGGSIKEKV